MKGTFVSHVRSFRERQRERERERDREKEKEREKEKDRKIWQPCFRNGMN